MKGSKKIFFLSDAHLGYPNKLESREREEKLVSFLDDIMEEAEAVYLLGDMFDFWYEYSSVVPRGYVRFLGKLAALTDRGIPVHFFTGNHDIWAFKYLQEEIGLEIHREALITEIGSKRFFLSHGDGTDNNDKKFLLLKKLFTNRCLQWFFSRLHPNFAFRIASGWSKHSRMTHGTEPFENEREPMVIYARNHLLQEGLDFIIFGHRHCPADYTLSEDTRMIILGDWITHFTYGEFDGESFELKKFNKNTPSPLTVGNTGEGARG